MQDNHLISYPVYGSGMFPGHFLRHRAFMLICFMTGIFISCRAAASLPGDTVTLIGVGDIMLGTDYPSSRYLPPGSDCSFLLADVKHILVHADVTFGNLEGSFAGNKGTPKKCKDTTQCYVFRMPRDFAGCLKNAGFDAVSLANNHSGDFGPEGRLETTRVLDSLGIHSAGLIEKPWSIWAHDSVIIGFCAFAPNKGTCSLLDLERAEHLVAALAGRCDILLVSFHGGGEGREHQHVPRKMEEYLGVERGNVYEFAHRVIDAGADVVFGHGPHVTRAVEIYRKRFIAYSLGNFSTYARFNLRGPNGIAPVVKVFTDRQGQVYRVRVYSVKQNSRGATVIDGQNAAYHRMIELTREDFPEMKARFTEEGLIIPGYEK